jgi:hypothetical protein
MSDDHQKRELKRKWKADERQKLLSSIPLGIKDLRDLFDHLDRGGIECDHTLRETIEFLQVRGIEVAPVAEWLRNNGGFCDCEVIFNVDEKYGELVGR